jgi:hypothetical protein
MRAAVVKGDITCESCAMIVLGVIVFSDFTHFEVLFVEGWVRFPFSMRGVSFFSEVDTMKILQLLGVRDIPHGASLAGIWAFHHCELTLVQVLSLTSLGLLPLRRIVLLQCINQYSLVFQCLSEFLHLSLKQGFLFDHVLNFLWIIGKNILCEWILYFLNTFSGPRP